MYVDKRMMKKKFTRAIEKINLKKKLGQLKMAKNSKRMSFISGFTMDQNTEVKPFQSSTKSVFDEVIIGDEDVRVTHELLEL